ncbi:branched-chain amino acid ABC transporter substrate-binding protein [Sulfuricaulis limicola]|uniref:Branched-chain amino acid ABC transporter substrate-binding protein n=1 Tax=Sulfuricaulis limicola TaxID=1620215 RepID=A0A1B4XDC7_9GAMM|nr:amino acid ABC transporter substrate-binding protein [Sulfuricaulis limicola]BAV32780.1 branched-chain amino acid ABC transporter substrate-binding protein [Sulfuricaulis limicola]
MKHRLSLLAVFSAVLALLVTPVVTHAKDIVVGTSVALTGKYARTGQEQLQGFQMWVDEVNARGGLLGQKVKLVHYDDESKPETGARLYEKLITDDKVDLLIGPYSSDVTMAASTVAEKHNFPMVSSGASASEIWERGYKNTFGLYTLAELYMDQILELGKEKGLKKIALIYENTSFPRGVAAGVKTKAKQLGMQIVFEEEYGKASTDFSSMIIKIKSKKPDMVIGGSYLPDSTAFMRQAKENRLYAKIFAFAVGPGLPDFGTNLGLDAEGVMGNTQWEPTLKLPGAREFSAKYKDKYGHEPGYHAGGGYGAGYVLEAAVKKAGSTDRDKVREALFALDVVNAFGRFKVDATGKQIGKPAYAVQWLGGERHIVLPADAATAKVAYPFKDWGKR